MRHFESLLQECDADIRGGKPHQAIRRLTQIGTARIPRQWRLPIAKICRRAGLYSMGLRLLTRYVTGRERTASPFEIAEYSALLVRSGSVGEAFLLLEDVDTNVVPEASLIRAFAHFSLWEYGRAIPDLEAYLRTPLSPDANLVARSNLALAMGETWQFKMARQILEENVALARQLGYAHLENYNLATLAQVCLQEGKFAEARETIDRVVRDAAKAQTYNDWSTVKLKLIIDGLEHRDPKQFAELRQRALEKKDWPALREADLFSLKIDFRPETFVHLYFGSPLPGFRARIRHELGRVPDRTSYVLGKKAAPRFDVATGEISGKKIIRAGFKCHQLMGALLQDFYQPLRIGGLYAALFPNEQFDIRSSPDRVHQVVWRTRKWLSDHQIPVHIGEDGGFYSLTIQGDFSFRIPLDRSVKDLFQLHMEKLKSAFAGREFFSATEIHTQLGVSLASAHRLLQRAIESGEIERLGKLKRPSGYRFNLSDAA